MQYLLIMNLVITAFMAFCWTGKNWLNRIIKFAFVTATAFNIVAIFQQFGYIVKM